MVIYETGMSDQQVISNLMVLQEEYDSGLYWSLLGIVDHETCQMIHKYRQAAVRTGNQDFSGPLKAQPHVTIRYSRGEDTNIFNSVIRTLKRFEKTYYGLKTVYPISAPFSDVNGTIYAPIEANQLMELRSVLDDDLKLIGIPPMDGKYNPHITLGKSKQIPQVDVKKWIKGVSLDRYVLRTGNPNIE